MSGNYTINILIIVFSVFVKLFDSRGSNGIPCACKNEVKNLTTYTSSQVAEHSSVPSRVWVSYHSGVYDITDFIQKHPGGLTTILSCAGGHLEPYWNTLPCHKDERVYRILEEFRVGNLEISDRKTYDYDPFAAEKNRSHLMEVIAEEPYNAHARPIDLSKSFITPNELHYVRLHLPIPWLDMDHHKLTISGIGLRSAIILTMENIKKKLVKHLFNATLQCSGNRRREMNKIKLTHGVAYKHTAISTATWGGVWLVDLIKHFGINTKHPAVKYLNFEGADQDSSGMHFGTSILKETALDPEADFFLAYEMNGVPLPRDHGYPLRLIAPGMAGFRSVKFLHKLTFSDTQLTNVWEQRMYRFYSAKYDWDNVDFSSAPGLYYTNVQSAILIPSSGDMITVGKNHSFVMKGYAFSGGGNGILRVDVTIDGGETWKEANITEQLESSQRRSWTWIFWQATISLDDINLKDKNSIISISCRAFDTSYNTQPQNIRTIWNMMGVMVNHWHTVTVTTRKHNKPQSVVSLVRYSSPLGQ